MTTKFTKKVIPMVIALSMLATALIIIPDNYSLVSAARLRGSGGANIDLGNGNGVHAGNGAGVDIGSLHLQAGGLQAVPRQAK